MAQACGDGQAAHGRPPYREVEIAFRNPSDGVRLSGSLTVPDGAGPFPAVVLVHGSGPGRRDGEVGPHRLFLVLADHLGRHGVAVVRYDKRGCGRSGGTYEPYDLDTFAEDALAAVSWLGRHSAVDAGRIGALGISQGGLVVPLMASRTADLSFAVLMAAPGVWGKEFFRLSSVAVARASGFGEQQFTRIGELYDQAWPLWTKPQLAGSDAARARALVTELASYMTPEARAAFGMTDIEAYLSRTRSGRFLETLAHDPAAALKRVRCPVLAVTGSQDVQVSANENLAAIAAALREGGNPDHEVMELEGLNHLFQRCRTGLPDEYLSIREAMAAEALETVSSWILQTAAGAPGAGRVPESGAKAG